jgi:hypothetical protein
MRGGVSSAARMLFQAVVMCSQVRIVATAEAGETCRANIEGVAADTTKA